MTIGPIQAFVIGFPDNDLFEGRIAEELASLSDIGQIRIIDAVFVVSEDDDVAVLSVSDLGDDQRTELRAAVGALVGLGIAGGEGAVAGADAGASVDADAATAAERVALSLVDDLPDGTRRSCSRSSTCGPSRCATPCAMPAASCSRTTPSPPKNSSCSAWTSATRSPRTRAEPAYAWQGGSPVKQVAHLSVDERIARGKAARESVEPDGHTGWEPAPDRPDPVALLEEQNETREPDLVPVRHGRMMVSPFTFYRGAAKIMAADLSETPTAGLDVQLCGDAHLSNFGVYASPERTLVFDLNDFDETLPGPFEYDIIRLAASFTIAARNNSYSNADSRAVTLASVNAYRTSMIAFAAMGTLDTWYDRMSEQDIMRAIDTAARSMERSGKKKIAKNAERGARKTAEKARSRDSLQALSKLAEPSTVSTESSASRRSWCRCRRWPNVSAYPPTNSSNSSTSSSGRTGRRWSTTAGTSSNASSSSTRHERSSVSEASAPAPTSSCSKDAMSRTRCSSRSRKQRNPCSRITCRRAGTPNPASAWCTGSG